MNDDRYLQRLEGIKLDANDLQQAFRAMDPSDQELATANVPYLVLLTDDIVERLMELMELTDSFSNPSELITDLVDDVVDVWLESIRKENPA